jgi:hypothetical protein
MSRGLGTMQRRPKRVHPWVDTYGEEDATLWYPRERRVRFVRRGSVVG